MGKRRRSAVHGVLIVDKPRGPTSHDVVSLARRAFGTRTVGHAGTLDPMATGVLVIGVGEGTKLLRWLTADAKRYTATVRLGVQTDTLDADGEVVKRAAVEGVTLESARAAAAGFVGTFQQTPPIYSAIKQGGESLHKKARRGEAVEVPSREVTVHSLDVHRVSATELELEVASKKGFYVRSLGRDLAEAVGTCGHLTALRRVASGAFTLVDATSGARLQEAAKGDEAARAEVHRRLLPLHEACRSMPRVRIDEAAHADALHGRPVRVPCAELPIDQPVALIGPDGTLTAVAERRGSRLQVLRGIRM